jgi:hypothetical protein
MGFTSSFLEYRGRPIASRAPLLIQHYPDAPFKRYPDPAYFLPDPVAARIFVHTLQAFSCTLKMPVPQGLTERSRRVWIFGLGSESFV